MGKMRKPSKVKIRKAGNSVSNVQRDSDLSKEERARRIDEMLNAQEFVDKWNNEFVGKKGMDGKDLTEAFKNIQLESGMVIQMYMENPIKALNKDQDDNVLAINYSLRQIDARVRNTDAPKWVTTPFPVIDKGVIMAISPQTKL